MKSRKQQKATPKHSWEADIGSLPLRSASSTKALAYSPLSTGDELIVIAISNSVLIYKTKQKGIAASEKQKKSQGLAMSEKRCNFAAANAE